MNGDSFMEMDLHELLNSIMNRRAVASMAVRRVEMRGPLRYRTAGRREKGHGIPGKNGDERPGMVNAGVYYSIESVLQQIPEGTSSLEKDVFPGLLGRPVFLRLEQQGIFIDIGTPEDYARAQEISDRLYEAASLKQ